MQNNQLLTKTPVQSKDNSHMPSLAHNGFKLILLEAMIFNLAMRQ